MRARHAITPALSTAWLCKCQRCGYRWLHPCDCDVTTTADVVAGVSSPAHKDSCAVPPRCANQECKSRSWASVTERAGGRPSAEDVAARLKEIAKRKQA
jgi:hypothetical protein